MKTYKSLLLAFFISVLFAACTSTTYMQVLQPADISLPPYIQRIGIVNRCIPDKESTFMNIMEGVLTGESIGADREGAENTMMGLKNVLDQTNRYEVSIPAVSLKNEGMGAMPPALDWTLVHEICKRHNLDALVVLESFDSDSRIVTSPRQRKVKNKEGVETIINEFVAHADLRIRSKWRVYADSTRDIIDQFSTEDVRPFENVGPTPEAAAAGLPYKRSAINSAGLYVGSNYGNRIAPKWITVGRYYYTKGNDAIKWGAQKAKRDDWKTATEIWRRELSSTDKKVAQRALYNMALACERNGNLDLALEYAKKSYQMYGNKKARDYTYILEQRKRDQAKLDYQMQGK